MKLYRVPDEIVLEAQGKFFNIPSMKWDNLVNRDDLFSLLKEISETATPLNPTDYLTGKEILPPLVSQEVWAAGVTYFRSKVARMEESKDAGGGDFYDKVYSAARPEIFFKAMPYSVVGHLGKVRIRKDSTWDVPEPELTLFITSKGKIAGYTIGNDMSSRSIEGENPLYLPQAKVYDGSAALGPCLYITDKSIPASTNIALQILRNGNLIFEGTASLSQMKRSLEELRDYLFHSSSYPNGCFLMTGTCVVPDHPLTLQSGDKIQIQIDHIGELINIVE